MAGTKMVQSDGLSRRPDYVPENDMDNEDITMLPDDLFIGLIDTDRALRSGFLAFLGRIEDWTGPSNVQNPKKPDRDRKKREKTGPNWFELILERMY
jgi:hypothetical protein